MSEYIFWQLNIMNEMYIVSFNSTHQAIKCDKTFAKNNIDYAVLPTPREITQSCGISVKFSIDNIENVKKIMAENEIEYKGIFKIVKLEGGKKHVEEIC